MARTLAVIKGATPAQAIAKYPGPTTTRRRIVRGGRSPARARPPPVRARVRAPSRSAARPRARPTTRRRAKALKRAACSSTTCSEANDADPRAPLHTRLLTARCARRVRAARARLRPRGRRQRRSTATGPTRARPSRHARHHDDNHHHDHDDHRARRHDLDAGCRHAGRTADEHQRQAPALEGPDAGEAQPPRSPKRASAPAPAARTRARAAGPSQTGRRRDGRCPGKHPAPPPRRSRRRCRWRFSPRSAAARLLHRKLPDPAVPAADLPGGRHRLRHPMAGAGRDQRGRDRLRARPQRLQRRRRGLDAVPAPEWAHYGVDANGDGYKDPYNPADAIFAAARYLRAAGGESNIRAAVFSYNHSQHTSNR